MSAAAANPSKALQQLQALSGPGSNRYASEPKSSIVSLGLSVHNTPVDIREKLATPQDQWRRAIAELTAYPHIEEAAVLSTCNRMEVYVVALSWHRGVREVEDWMCKRSGIPLDELREHLFLLRDHDATQHLLRVSGGLESLVMGEGQILSQVKSVYQEGQDAQGFGRHMNGLFKAAVTAGKRVRTETSISSGAVSVSSAAAELCQLKLPSGDFNDARILIVGAGKMSRLLVKHLASKGCSKVTLVNRSMGSAQALADEFPDVEFDIKLSPELLAATAEADVVFTAASADDPLLSKADLEGMPAAQASVGGVRRLFDIGVPRNIAADVNELEDNRAFNVDDLKEVVDKNKEARTQAAREAEELLEQELLSFEAWRDSLETVPTIKRLRTKAESIRSVELEKALGRLGDGLTKKQRKTVEELTKGIVNKLLHGPMACLRSDGDDPEAVAQTLVNMHALERMFSLSEEDETRSRR